MNIAADVGNAQIDNCTKHQDCKDNLQCIKNQCVDACQSACGESALCIIKMHLIICQCPANYTGDPFEKCEPIEPIEPMHVTKQIELDLRNLITTEVPFVYVRTSSTIQDMTTISIEQKTTSNEYPDVEARTTMTNIEANTDNPTNETTTATESSSTEQTTTSNDTKSTRYDRKELTEMEFEQKNFTTQTEKPTRYTTQTVFTTQEYTGKPENQITTKSTTDYKTTSEQYTTSSSVPKVTTISGQEENIPTSIFPRGNIPDSLVTESGAKSSSTSTEGPSYSEPSTEDKNYITASITEMITGHASTKQPKEMVYSTPIPERTTLLPPRSSTSAPVDITTTENDVTEPRISTHKNLVPSLRSETEGFDDFIFPSTSTFPSGTERSESTTKGYMFTEPTTGSEFTTFTTEAFIHSIMTEAAEAATDVYINAFTTETSVPCNDSPSETKVNCSTKIPIDTTTLGTTVNPFTDPNTWTTMITSEKITTDETTTPQPKTVTDIVASTEEITTEMFDKPLPSFNQSCTHNSNCSESETCIEFKCVDPCSFYNPCIPNVPCNTTNHEIQCQCDAFAPNSTSIIQCNPNPGKKSGQMCSFTLKLQIKLHIFFRKSVLEIKKMEICLSYFACMLFSKTDDKSNANHMKQPIDKIPCESSV